MHTLARDDVAIVSCGMQLLDAHDHAAMHVGQAPCALMRSLHGNGWTSTLDALALCNAASSSSSSTLRAAADHLGVVCAAPTAIMSLYRNL